MGQENKRQVKKVHQTIEFVDNEEPKEKKKCECQCLCSPKEEMIGFGNDVDEQFDDLENEDDETVEDKSDPNSSFEIKDFFNFI